jgi:hypothetical protein
MLSFTTSPCQIVSAANTGTAVVTSITSASASASTILKFFAMFFSFLIGKDRRQGCHSPWTVDPIALRPILSDSLP